MPRKEGAHTIVTRPRSLNFLHLLQQRWTRSANSDQGVMRSTDDTQEWLVWNRPAQDWGLH
ncbi:hypothetical protein JAAARDRAFT_39454 [Jaapia argillacea MUCL 33604]|uniref:Uncharacterized protein n=1 Tax=Jaapia argillacea MUCL 33604 TaxID=933084 RepID=A0A067PQ25_9AGAM|nr:hypothetical protein JAAARDRAFT_39454 [Jaapia argillacea MUCL 33604]